MAQGPEEEKSSLPDEDELEDLLFKLPADAIDAEDLEEDQ